MARRKGKKEDFYNDPYPDMNGDFAFIAGYTSGGAPYGVRWEDVGISSDLPFEEKVQLYRNHMSDQAEKVLLDDSEALPFN
ncbi:MAG: hypothetical protein IJH60_07615 [Eubacterium sp.]|nr:hypothetical protein [Eubacterium sp.]